MIIEFLLNTFKKNQNNDALVWNGKTIKYKTLLKKYRFWKKEIELKNIKNGTVTVVEADFSPNSISLLLALIDKRCIFVPITKSIGSKHSEFIKICEGEVLIKVDGNDDVSFTEIQNNSKNNIYKYLRKKNHPGLVLFSSGSTGKSKASVHDITDIIEKYRIKRHIFRTIVFLLYDHIGGFNTLFYTLSNAGLIVTIKERSPELVLKTIELYKVELLPTSPTFINLILLSEAYKKYDISSLKIVTYGTEPMPKITLKRFNQLFPKIKMLQTYGLSEVGILSSKSKSSDSLWVRIGGAGFKTRVVDGLLEIKARSAMLGYLNAPSPFTEDGWFKTGDSVEVNGEYMKILGRKSEIINVGGEKVYPQEVENVILEIDNVAEVTVYSQKNPIIGNMICAKIRLKNYEKEKEFKVKLKKYCSKKLLAYKIPIKIKIDFEKQHNMRFKKSR